MACSEPVSSLDAIRPVNYSERDSSPEAISQDVAYALEVGFNMLTQLKDLQPLRYKVILEIGPGINFGPILVLACHGAVPIVADRFLAPWNPSYHPLFYSDFRSKLVRDHPEIDTSPIDCLLASQTYRENVPRRVNSAAESLDLEDDSVDIIVSNAVMEHFEDHQKACSELYRVTKSGGWGFHQIDFRYHPSFDRPLEHLLMSPDEFKRVATASFRECGTYLRPFEVAQMFGNCGFELKNFIPNLLASPEYMKDFLPRLREARNSPYRLVPEEKLQVVSAFFVVRKP